LWDENDSTGELAAEEAIAEQERNRDADAVELSDDEHEKQAEILEKVNLLCRIAEVHLEDLDDEYEANSYGNDWRL